MHRSDAEAGESPLFEKRTCCTQACIYDDFVMHHSYEAHLFSFFICITISENNDVVSSDQLVVPCTHTYLSTNTMSHRVKKLFK